MTNKRNALIVDDDEIALKIIVQLKSGKTTFNFSIIKHLFRFN